jgi:hypothetical protein
VQLKVMGINSNMDSGFRRNDEQRCYCHTGLDPASSFSPTVLITPEKSFGETEYRTTYVVKTILLTHKGLSHKFIPKKIMPYP